MSVDVLPLHQTCLEIPMPKDVVNLPRTPFSFQRFLIPAVKGYSGRGIYLDSDMQVFKDIRELWTLPFDGSDLLGVQSQIGSERRPQFSVMLLDCEALAWKITDIVEGVAAGRF